MTAARWTVWGPWAIGAAIVAALLLRADAGATLEALSGGDLLRFLPLAVLFLFVWLAIDAFVLARLFSALLGPLPWSAMLRWRAATYPLLALSFHAANAALLAPLHARTGAPWARLGGGMLVHYGGDLAALSSLALVASFFTQGAGGALARPVLAVVVLGLLGVALAARAGRGWLRGKPVVDVLEKLSLADLAQLVLGRWVWYAAVIAFVALTLPSFGLQIPTSEVAARMPLVLVCAALPISPGGLGTLQAAMLALFAPFASQPVLLAYALAYSAVLLLLRIPFGLLFWLATKPLAERAELTP